MEILEWLESLREQGMKLGLENTSEVLLRLGDPQNNFPSIHVAGSNGKGTTCSLLSNAFTLSGYKTGLFTSPHLCNVEERIRIDGTQISKLDFLELLEKLYGVCEIEPKQTPTYYEATFIIAMMYFSSLNIDRAIIETGLGGRLDATRLVNADCCILTQISLEHTEILGNNILEITKEKSAIARNGKPMISIWNEDPGVRKVITEAVSSPELISWYKTNESDNFLSEAIGLANVALSKLKVPISCDEAAKITLWPGRMQSINYSDNITFLLDCAHNPSGISRAINEIKMNHKEVDQVIFGCTKQTDLDAFLKPLIDFIQLGKIRNLILTEPQGGRTKAIPTKILKNYFINQIEKLKIFEEKDPFDALNVAKSFNYKSKLLCIGSLYLIGNILKIIKLDDPDSMKIFRK